MLYDPWLGGDLKAEMACKCVARYVGDVCKTEVPKAEEKQSGKTSNIRVVGASSGYACF